MESLVNWQVLPLETSPPKWSKVVHLGGLVPSPVPFFNSTNLVTCKVSWLPKKLFQWFFLFTCKQWLIVLNVKSQKLASCLCYCTKPKMYSSIDQPKIWDFLLFFDYFHKIVSIFVQHVSCLHWICGIFSLHAALLACRMSLLSRSCPCVTFSVEKHVFHTFQKSKKSLFCSFLWYAGNVT